MLQAILNPGSSKGHIPLEITFYCQESSCSLAREESMKISFEEQPFTETSFTG